MSWAEIKHSINSDLNKPLNELITESKRLVESDNLYYMILRDSKIVDWDNQTIGIAQIRFNWAGSVKLKFYLYGVSRSSETSTTWTYDSVANSNAIMDIYINDVLTSTFYGLDESEIQKYVLDINKNDIMKIVFRTDNTTNYKYGGKLEQLGIYADSLDILGITII